MPSFSGIEVDFEAEPTVGIYCIGISTPRSDRHCTDEIAIAIDCPELLLCLRPLRNDAAATHDVAGFHLKNVCEVAAQRDLKLKADTLHAVVGDVEILVHTAAD